MGMQVTWGYLDHTTTWGVGDLPLSILPMSLNRTQTTRRGRRRASSAPAHAPSALHTLTPRARSIDPSALAVPHPCPLESTLSLPRPAWTRGALASRLA